MPAGGGDAAVLDEARNPKTNDRGSHVPRGLSDPSEGSPGN
jgi:hypothetical protein